MNTAFIQTLHVGKEEPLADSGSLSSINKQKVDSAQQVSKLGLVNDTQSDKKNHGGEDKAIHQYPWERYEYWKNFLPDCEILTQPGAFGENISSLGMTEDTVFIGDRYRLGTCILEVSQARQPCWKLNYRFNYPQMSEKVQNTLQTGWYYRVIEEGTLQPGDTFELLERPYPEYNLNRLLHLLYKDSLNREELHQAKEIKPLAESWRRIFINRIENGTVENWERRLFHK